MKKNKIATELAEKYFKDIFYNLGNYNELFNITLIMQELYIENLRLYNKLNPDVMKNFAASYQDSIMNIIKNNQREH